ncbi:protein LLP homolog [Euwallacea fornicatus]|uniref:protein LLP homolog n=1 Tax=Euwallacea fornicatus TaxID=995702 RepID=UPI00338F7A13
MAKSLRSKWRRKCRAVKRVRYGAKELERLKKTLANDPLTKKNSNEVKNLIEGIEEIANVITPKEIEENNQESQEESTLMDIDEIRKEFNSKTLRDKNGAYPVWVHPRKIKAGKKKNRKMKKKVSKLKPKSKKSMK